MIPSYKTSVTSEKFLMSQKPKMHITFFPGNIGFISTPSLMFFEMISEPASPKPKASSPPILDNVFSKILVSITSFFFYLLFGSSIVFSCSSSANYSVSSSCAAFKGFSVILFTFFIIASIGDINNSFVIFVRVRDPDIKVTHTIKVVRILKMD